VPISLKPLRCPHCQKEFSKNELKESPLKRALQRREAIVCPQCQQGSKLPEIAEKLISTGILFAVFFAPGLVYWGQANNWAMATLVLGAVLIIYGAGQQQLVCTDIENPTSKNAEEDNHE